MKNLWSRVLNNINRKIFSNFDTSLGDRYGIDKEEEAEREERIRKRKGVGRREIIKEYRQIRRKKEKEEE